MTGSRMAGAHQRGKQPGDHKERALRAGDVCDLLKRGWKGDREYRADGAEV